jgi:hypothetical protein
MKEPVRNAGFSCSSSNCGRHVNTLEACIYLKWADSDGADGQHPPNEHGVKRIVYLKADREVVESDESDAASVQGAWLAKGGLGSTD